MIVLTPREQDVLRLVALTEQQTADRLGISRRTVQNHSRHLRRKFGVASRDELWFRVTR